MKFIEQQLVSALKETPPETECSVSIAVLDSFGLHGVELQSTWLSTYRPAKDNRGWQRIGEHWEYSTLPDAPAPLPAASDWRTAETPPERLTSRIVVKPVVPFGIGKS